MKSTKDFRNQAGKAGSEELIKRAIKLDPIKKSGKDKYTIFSKLDDDDDELLDDYKKKESILDYLDDEDEDDLDE